jgi:hypothetical protein
LVFWIAMTVVWFRWSVREERGDAERKVPLEAYGVEPTTPMSPRAGAA